MTTALVPCPGCSTRYDLSRRSPGKRVRCPKCQGVLVVPEPHDELPPLGPEHSSSARLRRARGPVCNAHPRAMSDGRCDGCGAHACSACWAAPPIDHLCVACVDTRGLGAPLPIDFGPLATPRLALGPLLRTFPRALVWNVGAVAASSLLFGIPMVFCMLLFRAVEVTSWTADVMAGLVLACVLGGLLIHNFLLVPAGCAVFVDQDLRGLRPGFGAALAEACRRTARNFGTFVGVTAVLALLLVPIALLVLGSAYILLASGSDAARAAAGVLVLAASPVVFFPIVTALGLAVPVVILEERTALAALQRAWELARRQLHVVGLLVVSYFALKVTVSAALAALPALQGLPGVGLLLSTCVDLVWPALLVTAYHGLVAEQVAIPGRK